MLAAHLFPDLDHLNKMGCLPVSRVESGYWPAGPVHKDTLWSWAMSLLFMIYAIASLFLSNSVSLWFCGRALFY